MVMAPRFDRGLTVVRCNYSIYMMVSIEVRVLEGWSETCSYDPVMIACLNSSVVLSYDPKTMFIKKYMFIAGGFYHCLSSR